MTKQRLKAFILLSSLALALVALGLLLHRGVNSDAQSDSSPNGRTIQTSTEPGPVGSDQVDIIRELSSNMDKLLSDHSLTCDLQIRAFQQIVSNPHRWTASWWQVKEALAKQQCPLVGSRSTSNGFVASYLIRRGVLITPEVRWDLYLDVNAAGTGSAATVSDVSAQLRATIKMPYSELAQRELMPKGSVLELVLNRPEMAYHSRNWPQTRAISVSYSPMFLYASSEICSAQFQVDVDLGVTNGEDRNGMRLAFAIESGLDPLRLWDGTILEDLPFEPHDTFGHISLTVLPLRER